MADAGEALGMPQVAGTFVSRKGLTKKVTSAAAGGQIAGLAGTLAASAIANRGSHATPDLPDFGATGYVAISEQALALVKVKTGLMSPKVTNEVLASVPRSSIQSIDFDAGYLSSLKIEFTDGKQWEFEIPRVFKKSATELVEALGAPS
jgi:hypothetical protein